TEAFCMIASISRRVLRKASSVRSPPAFWMTSSADFRGGGTAMSPTRVWFPCFLVKASTACPPLGLTGMLGDLDNPNLRIAHSGSGRHSTDDTLLRTDCDNR